MARKNEEKLASTSALMLDQFMTHKMTGWLPRGGSDEFNTLTLLRRDGRFFLSVTDKQQEIAEIALDDVVSYVIKVPTWHEVKQADTSMIALHLSKASNFEQFSDLLVSTLKVLNKYDRLTARVGADGQTFLDELKIVRVRMEQMSLRQQPTGGPTGVRRPLTKTLSVDPAMSSPGQKPPPPPPPARQKVIKMPSLPPRPVTAPQGDLQIQTQKPFSIPLSEVVSLPYIEIQ